LSLLNIARWRRPQAAPKSSVTLVSPAAAAGET
jgi:hypothetical protein